MNIRVINVIIFLLLNSVVFAQDWTLKLSSNIELRKWKLSSKAEKEEKSLGGAAIMLYKGDNMIGQTMSDGNGDFVIDVPAKGDFVLTVSYAGCNTKKFYVSTNSVPDGVSKDNYKPTVIIGGFIMSRPITGVDYIGLNEPLVKVEYKSGGQNFDKDEAVTNKGISIISKIGVSENAVIEKFCSFNKQGDDALKKKKCALAKECYTNARKLMPDEKYPVEQLEKAEECLSEKKSETDAAAEVAAVKAAGAKAANDKAIKEKQVKENAVFQKNAVTKDTKTKTAPEKTNPVAAEKTNSIVPKNAGSKPNPKNNGGGKSKHTIPALLDVDKYKETICRADNFFKSKRYKEAKAIYNEALKLKTKDPYSQGKITECDQLLAPKS
jgi:hypothetical protein